MKRCSFSLLAIFLTVSLSRAGTVVELDAGAWPAGEIKEVLTQKNGSQWNVNAPLRTEEVQGRRAFVFNDRQQLISQFALPAGFEKLPFTVEAWVYTATLEKLGTVVALAPATGGAGAEFNLASSPTAGAFRTGFKATAPFVHLPSAGAWHHLAWTYDGILKVYVDGELDGERPLKFVVPPQARLHVGASGEVDSQGPKKPFVGAVASVRISDGALSQAALRASAGLKHAFAPMPGDGSTIESLAPSLQWQRGTPEATSYAVYFSRDRDAVTRADSTVVHATVTPQFEPAGLQVGVAYFWKVDKLDGAGKLLVPGVVWSFVADRGLATDPQPRDHDSNLSVETGELRWQPGKYASRQRIFLGRQLDGLAPIAMLAGPASTCPLPEKLAPGTRYFWRIDSENAEGQPDSRGPTWTFRTQDQPAPHDVTFFVSSDAHYGRENNAAINRRVIDAMNDLPGEPLPASVGGGVVHTPRGVVLNGDLLDEGFNPETAPALWAEFCHDYGLTGRDGRLCFPVYEGFGNHDGGPSKSFVRAGIRERNPRRVGVKTISESGLHYAWDWDQLHLVQLNLFGGTSTADLKGVNGPEHDPEGSLDFLVRDLKDHIGTSGRPVIVFQHFSWIGGMADWWQAEAKERFYEAVKPYNIPCLINGHSHGAAFAPWHDLLTIHDGSLARGDADDGDFLVVRITDTNLTVIQRKASGGWGIFKSSPLHW